MFLVLSNSDDYVNRQPKMFSIKDKQLGTLFFSYHIKKFFLSFWQKYFFVSAFYFQFLKNLHRALKRINERHFL